MSENFPVLGVSERIDGVLRERGITKPFAIQRRVIADALAGRDVLAKSPTGSGKTLAFGIPIAQRADPAGATPQALVLVPTRELAQQVADEIEPLCAVHGVRVAVVHGGVGLDRQARLARRAHVLVATPGRLEDLLARRLVRIDQVTLLVLDEADRMLDLGFQPAVDRLVALVSTQRQTMYFSATLDARVARHAATTTSNPVQVAVEPAPAEPLAVSHRFVEVTHDAKLETLVALLAADRQLALVFVRTKRGAARLADRLEARGVRCAALHGDMTQGQRSRSLARFGNGHADTLVATDVAARGLHVDDISHVINFDPPDDAVAHTHRLGRTGRAGRAGEAITLVEPGHGSGGLAARRPPRAPSRRAGRGRMRAA
jgi:ATP-dependent RNA helicase RhlE